MLVPWILDFQNFEMLVLLCKPLSLQYSVTAAQLTKTDLEAQLDSD